MPVRVLSKIQCCAMAVLLVFGLGTSSALIAVLDVDDAYAGAPLDVYVGYSGGPYYLKHTYSNGDLESLAVGPYAYSALDNKPSLVKMVAWGVPLESLFATASDNSTGYAVNSDALWRLAFDTDDDYKPDNGVYGNDAWYWDTYDKFKNSRLLNTAKTPRYYYSAFGENFDYSSTTILNGQEGVIAASGNTVPTMIALRYNKDRITSLVQWNKFDSYGLADLMDSHNNRLLYGQAYVGDQDVENELHSINGLYCIYSGKPEVNIDKSSVKGNIGETVRVQASITAADPLIAQEGVKDIRWSTSDPSVATVSPNGDGSATVLFRGKGDVIITATFGNSTSSEFVAKASTKGSGPGGSGWRGDGEGEGKEYGEGDGEQGPGANSGDGPNDGFNDAGESGSAETGDPGATDGNLDTPSRGQSMSQNQQSTGYFTEVPRDAIPVAIAGAAKATAASSGQDMQSGEGDEEVTEEELVEKKEKKIYRINQTNTPFEESPDIAQSLPKDSVGLPGAIAYSIAALMLAGGLAQFLFYYHSTDRTNGFRLSELFVRIPKEAKGA